MRILGLIAAFLLWVTAAAAQSVTVIGAVTPGDCTKFFSTTQIADAGAACGSGGGGGSNPGGVTNSVQTQATATTFGGDGSFLYLTGGIATLGTAGSVPGIFEFFNGTSGQVNLQTVTGALGTTTLLLPAPNTTATLATTANINTALPSINTNQLYGGTGSAGAAQAVNIGSGLTYTSGTQTLSATGGGGGSNGISFKRDYLASLTPSGSNQFESQFTGTCATTNLTTTSVTGTIQIGTLLTGTGITAGTYIVSQTSGTTGGAGVYVMSASGTCSGAAVTSVGFVASTSPTSIFLPAIPASATNLLVYFDGAEQAGYTWSVSTQTLTLAGGTNLDTQVIEVVGITLSGTGAGGANCNVQYNSSGGFGGQASACLTFGSGTMSLALGTAGSVLGTMVFANTTSGTTTLQASAGVLGSGTLNLPTVVGTDTLTANAATQTLTNKALTSPTINSAAINTSTIAGGTINSASVGATTPSTGAFTTLAASSTVTLSGLTSGTPTSSICLDASNIARIVSGSNCFAVSSNGLYGNLINAVNETTNCNTAGHPVDPTNTSDSTAGINACITTYGVISLPKGTFKISGTGITISTTGQGIVGAGPNFTTLSQTSTTGNVINVTGGGTAGVFTGLTLNRTVVPSSGANGFGLNGSAFTNVDNWVVRDIISTNNWVGFAFPASDYSVADNLIALNNYSDGFRFVCNGINTFQWVGNALFAQENNGNGFAYTVTAGASGSCAALQLTNSGTFANLLSGFSAIGTASAIIGDLRVVQWNGSGDCGDGFFLNTFGPNNVFMGGLLETTGLVACGRNQGSPASHTGDGFTISGNNSDVSISGMKITNNSGNGINTGGTLGTIIITGNQITGNSVFVASQNGITIGPASTVAIVTGNTTSPTGGNQVNGLFSNSANTSATGNIFLFNVTNGCGGTTYTKAGNIGSGC